MQSTTKSRTYVCVVSGIAAIAGLLFGFDTGIISGALLFIEKDFVVSTELKELIVSSVLFGAMFGSLFSGRLTDHFGRRRLMLIISGLFILGTAIASTATQIKWNTGVNGRRYDVVLRFNYQELQPGNPDTLDKVMIWNLGSQKSISLNGGEVLQVSYFGEDFYTEELLFVLTHK